MPTVGVEADHAYLQYRYGDYPDYSYSHQMTTHPTTLGSVSSNGTDLHIDFY